MFEFVDELIHLLFHNGPVEGDDDSAHELFSRILCKYTFYVVFFSDGGK